MSAPQLVTFRPTAEDWRLVRRYSRATGLSQSELIRRAIRMAGPALVSGMAAAAAAVQAAVTGGKQP